MTSGIVKGVNLKALNQPVVLLVFRTNAHLAVAESENGLPLQPKEKAALGCTVLNGDQYDTSIQQRQTTIPDRQQQKDQLEMIVQ